ncbi:hypothetical protein EIN_281370 [Entamoeba invadens IP1]|uniref:PPM-type phosphatase domain-containing protein n=1 Tax=Entamoeba invadens IP1 TaxID=370355 RepID=A0A0A1TZY5_ENTIV|nr:hypothetical protein EIN_281370 [Entamoeba invadens IP1]ELP85776.1 hypothetical protein EIN_281370 [Entamoeba invadens IP1]|eukprot:XP_004185122.1 hypothetical protein EIN_281370 [Entamoeba invadens IP1]
MSETASAKVFNTTFKKALKCVPDVKFNTIDNSVFSRHIIENPSTIVGHGFSFGLSSFNNYPVFPTGDKQGEPNSDYIGILRFKNATCLVVCDGCGWNKDSARASKLAVETILSLSVEILPKADTLRNAAKGIVNMMSCAHDKIVAGNLIRVANGTTTILVAFTVCTKKHPQTIFVSVGDCEAFIYQHDTNKTIPINKKWQRPLEKVQDSLGCIGCTANGLPDLKTHSIKVFKTKVQDVVIVTTDGMSDNISMNNNYSKKVLDEIITEKMKKSSSLINFIEQMNDFVITSTADLKSFHVNNPTKKREVGMFQGKLDHTTIGTYMVDTEYIDIGIVDNFHSYEIEDTYTPHSLRQTRSLSLGSKDLVNHLTLSEKDQRNSSEKEFSSFEPFSVSQKIEYSRPVYTPIFKNKGGAISPPQLDRLSPLTISPPQSQPEKKVEKKAEIVFRFSPSPTHQPPKESFFVKFAQK